MTFGRGDAILRYPELIDPFDTAAQDMLYAIANPYVAVHLGASEAKKIPPDSQKLIDGLRDAYVPFLLVGSECSPDRLPNFRLHVEFVRRAKKFIGTLSVFNVVAQVLKIPSFVLVNRSIQEPTIYAKMYENGAQIVPWNVPNYTIDEVYAEAIKWAQS